MVHNTNLSMRTLLLTFTIMAVSLAATAQPLNPVSWDFALDTNNNGAVQVKASATIDQGWKLYAHHIEDGGPIPTNLVINQDNGIQPKDKIEENGNLQGPEIDEIFDMEVSYFTNTATFSRRFRHKQSATSVTGHVEYMVCDDQKCLPPEEVKFDLKL